MELYRFGYLVADRVDGIERGHRVLKDHSDLAPANPSHLVVFELHQVAAVEDDLARDRFSRRENQPHYRKACDGFAAARLADERERRAALDGKAHVVNRFDRARAREKVRAQVLDFEDVVHNTIAVCR